MRYLILASLVAFLAGVSALHAAEPATGKTGQKSMQAMLNENHFYLAIGPSLAPDYEGSDDYSPYPLIIGRWQRGARFVEFEGDTLRANILPAGLLQAGPVLLLRQGRQDVSDDRIERMRHVRHSLEAGGFIGMEIRDPDELRRYADLRLQVVSDVTGVNNGYETRLNLRGGAPLPGPWTIDAEIFSDYGNANYMDSYFSVDADDASRSGLPQFHASSGFRDVGTDAMLTYHLSDHWGIGAIFEYKRMLGDAADSPVVETAGSADQFIGALTLTFEN
jgi:outer membrane protein